MTLADKGSKDEADKGETEDTDVETDEDDAEAAAAKAKAEADKKAKAAAARAKPASEGIKVGSAPGSAEPVTVRDGVVYIGSWDGRLYAIDAATGQQKWVFEGGKDPAKLGDALAEARRLLGEALGA